MYTDNATKLKTLRKSPYELVDNETAIIAYKSVRLDYHSVFNFQYFYEIGKEYESHCNCNLDNENSFGLSAWTKKAALDYHFKGKLLLVKIKIEDVGALIHNNNKIRCFKLEIIEEVFNK